MKDATKAPTANKIRKHLEAAGFDLSRCEIERGCVRVWEFSEGEGAIMGAEEVAKIGEVVSFIGLTVKIGNGYWTGFRFPRWDDGQDKSSY